eukprot:10735495-Ditylum_brightwellii.AAC.1
MSINGGFNSYKPYFTRFRQVINNVVFVGNTTTMSNLPTNGITKETGFENLTMLLTTKIQMAYLFQSRRKWLKQGRILLMKESRRHGEQDSPWTGKR